MHLRNRLAPSFLLLAALPGAASGQLAVEYRDADLGGTIDFVLRGPPGTLFVNILSLTEGPTPLPPSHPVGSLDVDLALFWLTFQVPGFFATVGASGENVEVLDVPNDPLLDGLVLNDQLVSVVGGKLTAKSTLCKIVFGSPSSWQHGLNAALSDRAGVPAIELDDGRVLLAGGAGATLQDCELYDPWLQTCVPAAPLLTGRAGHTVTKLADGRVLVAGGADVNLTVLASAEVFDPATGAWTAVGNMGTVRAGHSANLLPNGKVLIAGGTTDVSDVVAGATAALKSTEFFNPKTSAFGGAPSLARPHVGHIGVSTAAGDVLIAGGGSFSTVFGIKIPEITDRAQTYLAGSNSFSSEATMKAARVGPGAVLLNSGKILVAGGIGGPVTAPVNLATAEVFDPATGKFALTAGGMSQARAAANCVVLAASNLVLVAAGTTGTSVSSPLPTDLAELFDPATGLFTVAPSIPEARAGCGALLLPTNHVALFGGDGLLAPPAYFRD